MSKEEVKRKFTPMMVRIQNLCRVARFLGRGSKPVKLSCPNCNFPKFMMLQVDLYTGPGWVARCDNCNSVGVNRLPLFAYQGMKKGV